MSEFDTVTCSRHKRSMAPRPYDILYRLHWRLVHDDIFVLAASVAYAALLSLFPLLLGLIFLFSRFVEREHAQQAILAALGPYLPPAALTMVGQTLNAVVPMRGAVGAFAVVGLFWGATTAASAMRHGLNRVLQVHQARPFWRRKLVELALVALAGGFLSLSLVGSVAGAAIKIFYPLVLAEDLLRRSRLITSITVIGPWIFSSLAFLIVYRFLPNTRLSWRTLLVGSLIGVLMFQGIEQAFFWYLRTLAGYPPVYGPLVGVVVFMVWVYLGALVLLIGGTVMMESEASRRFSGGDGADQGGRRLAE
jgi:membrane protein